MGRFCPATGGLVVETWLHRLTRCMTAWIVAIPSGVHNLSRPCSVEATAPNCRMVVRHRSILCSDGVRTIRSSTTTVFCILLFSLRKVRGRCIVPIGHTLWPAKPVRWPTGMVILSLQSAGSRLKQCSYMMSDALHPSMYTRSTFVFFKYADMTSGSSPPHPLGTRSLHEKLILRSLVVWFRRRLCTSFNVVGGDG